MKYFISKQQIFNENIQNTTIDHCLDYIHNLNEIAFDSETTGYDPHTCDFVSIQVGDTNNQFVIDCSNFDYLLLKPILENKLIILQNAQFDLRFLYKKNIYLNKLYDTFLAECILTTGFDDSERQLGLDALTIKYTDGKLNKNIRGEINREGLTLRVINYAAEDIRYLHEIKNKQIEQINKYKLQNVLNLENEVVKVFARMSYNGIRLDKNKWIDVAKQTKSETDRLISELDELVENEPKLSKFVPKAYQQNLFGFKERKLTINWASPAQKLEILKTLGIELDSVGDKILQQLINAHKIIPKLRQLSAYQKLNSAFGLDFLKFINKNTNRVHPQFWQILSTGRISTSNPKFLGVV